MPYMLGLLCSSQIPPSTIALDCDLLRRDVGSHLAFLHDLTGRATNSYTLDVCFRFAVILAARADIRAC